MKIVDNGNEKFFIINSDEKMMVYFNEEEETVEIFEETDPSHTGHFFESVEDFYYFINGLTEIAKKIKEKN
jgi:hypothetical protein